MGSTMMPPTARHWSPARRVARRACILAVSGFITAGLFQAAPAQETPSKQSPTALQTLPIPKDQIPLYSVVHEFFTLMGHFKQANPMIYRKRVQASGLEPDGPTGQVFDAAVDAAQDVIALPIADFSLADPQEFEAFEMKATREKAQRLAEVYGGLLADLEARGFDPAAFRAYLETKIRPSVSFFVEVPRGGDPVATLLGSSTMGAIGDFEGLAEAAYRSGATNMGKGGRP